MIVCVETFGEKYQNGNLDVYALHMCHWFSWKRVARYSNLNSKMGNLNWKSEILNVT